MVFAKVDLALFLLLSGPGPGCAAVGGAPLGEELASELASFVRCNADEAVNVIPVAQAPRGPGELAQARWLAKLLAQRAHFRVRMLSTRSQLQEVAETGGYPGNPARISITDFNIFVISHKWQEGNGTAGPMEDAELQALLSEAYDSVATLTWIKRSLLLLPTRNYPQNPLELLRQVAISRNKSSHFYATVAADNVNHWFQILTLLNQQHVVINELKFLGFEDKCIKEDYDLQGLHITSTSLTWVPYLSVSDCDEQGMDCNKNYGALVDIVALLEKRYNMTIHSYKDPNNDWGVYPKNGSHDYTGEWGGVMGDVILGRHPTSLSSWLYIAERKPLLDYAEMPSDYFILVLTPQPAKIDMDLFTRPFRDEAWVLIASTVLILLLTMVLPFAILPNLFEKTAAWRIIHLVSMLFFVLVNAFYGGAMTMFFTSEVSLPFQEIRDVMRDESWTLIVQKGNDANYQYLRDAGDPDFVKLFEQMDNEPKKTIFPNIAEGLRMLREGRNVMHVYNDILHAWLRENPFHQQSLYIFGKENPKPHGLIFAKNSPLTPVFQHGLRILQERSVLDRIFSAWKGRKILNRNNMATKTILTPGQTFTTFMMLMWAILLSVGFLLLEYIWKWVETHTAILRGTTELTDNSAWQVDHNVTGTVVQRGGHLNPSTRFS